MNKQELQEILKETSEEVNKWPDYLRSDEVKRELKRIQREKLQDKLQLLIDAWYPNSSHNTNKINLLMNLFDQHALKQNDKFIDENIEFEVKLPENVMLKVVPRFKMVKNEL